MNKLKQGVISMTSIYLERYNLGRRNGTLCVYVFNR